MIFKGVFVDGIYVDLEIADSYFMCDVKKCKGACCFMKGAFGAPLLEDEVKTIESVLPIVEKYLPEKNVKFIRKHGFYEKSEAGFTTNCIDNRECVFVFWEENIARCSFEKAFSNGEIDFIKPISCHLFPLRNYGIDGSLVGGESLKYVKINECKPGIENGVINGVKIYEFLRPALVRYFGEKWYSKMLEKIESQRSS